MDYHEIFDRLWYDYTVQNPSVKKVHDLLVAEGETVINDHIAFRTFNIPGVNADVLSQVFIEKGYEFRGQYHFEAKKLNAKHFEHKSDSGAPRVFISELLVEQFSDYLNSIARDWVSNIPRDKLLAGELIFSGNVSGIPSITVYENLRKESEYAAWLYVYGFRANHFTVSVNGLKKYDSIQKINEFLKSKGFPLNDAGAEIQGKPEDLLEQSSIKAGIINMQFREGSFEIPGCYYEFARRYKDANGKLYSGFIAKSADKIFESTNFYQK